MGLEFLYGASGHGKTYNLYSRIIKEASSCTDSTRKYILIVPEQSSLQAQKDIVRMHPNKGVFNIDVLTFGRLGYRVFEELSTNLCETVDDTGKNLIVRKVMNEVKDQLKILHVNRKIGVVTEVKSMISEFKQYGITVDALAEIIDRMSGYDRLKQKLNDVLIIYRGFEEYIKERYITAEDKPEELLRVIDKSAFFDNAVVAFDGFTGFTPVQYRLFEKILLKAEHVINTVTLPQDENYNVITGEEELFFMSKNMMRIMGKIADRNKVAVKYSPIDKDEEKFRFAKSPELNFLEQELFRYSGRTFEGEVADIHIRNMTTPQEEVRIAAADILSNVRKNNLRFRDIAIVTGDIALYGDYIRRIFEECDIPFFMDCKQSLIGNPVVEYIRSAIEVVCNNFSYESVFRFLKNGLCTIELDNVDALENYVLRFGIRGYNRWKDRFIRPYTGKKDVLSQANAARESFMEIIGDFYEAFNGDRDAHEKILAIYNLLEEAKSFEYLEKMSEELKQWEDNDRNMARAAQYGQTYDKIIGLLEQLDTLLGDERMSAEEFGKILDAGFEEIKVGIIPPSIDCVTVGDVERTRLEHVKVLFVLGVNEGILPRLSGNQGVLSENERRIMVENEIELAPTPRQKVFIQNFYLYLNLTEPEVALYLSCHRYNALGKETKPSRIINLIKNMYPTLNVVTEEELGPVDYLANPGNSMHLAVEGIFANNNKDNGIKEIVTFLMENEPYRSRLEYFVNILTKETLDKELSQAVANVLYKEIEKSSITRIETFAKCAFSHFMKYGMELKDRETYELSDLDLGNIFHNSIEMVSRKLRAMDKDFATVTAEERLEMVEACVMDATIDFNASFFIESKRNHYIKQRIVAILDGMVEILGKQLTKSKLKPNQFETTFRKDVDNVKITGKIDRVDIFEENDKVIVKVVDYKSSENDISIDDIYNGVNLQLMVYLNSVLSAAKEKNSDKKVIAAGALYSIFDNPIVDKADDMEKKLMSAMRPKGMVTLEGLEYMDDWEKGASLCIPATKKKDGGVSLGDHVLTNEQLILLSEFATNKMVELHNEIKAGKVSVNPCENACRYCDFKAVCGFDPQTMEYRKLESIKKDEEKWIKLGYKKDEGGNNT